MKGKKRGKQSRRTLSTVNANATGLDVGSTFHVVAVPPDRAEESVRTFRSFTGDLHLLADWLEELSITTIAMESTGVYWIPVFEILEERGFEVLVPRLLPSGDGGLAYGQAVLGAVSLARDVRPKLASEF